VERSEKMGNEVKRRFLVECVYYHGPIIMEFVCRLLCSMSGRSLIVS